VIALRRRAGKGWLRCLPRDSIFVGIFGMKTVAGRLATGVRLLEPFARVRRATFAQVAQLVEQRTENPCVDSSTLSLGTSASKTSSRRDIIRRASKETQCAK
jgi:hypothetical protein